MRTARRKKKTKRTGSRALFAALFVAAVTVSFAAGGQKKLAQAEDEYSVVAGTVFREPGFALGGAEVKLVPEGETKAKKQSFVTNSRGEFAFRVPASGGRFRLSASAKGFRSEEKTVTVTPGERVEVTFNLNPESN